MCKEELGFSQIIQALANKKLHITCYDKSIVIQCMLYNQFFKELPQNYADFTKSFIKDFLGYIYDSKQQASP